MLLLIDISNALRYCSILNIDSVKRASLIGKEHGNPITSMSNFSCL